MELDMNSLPRGVRLQPQALPGHTYTLPPIRHVNHAHLLPSAPPQNEIYEVLPPITNNRVQPVVPQPHQYHPPPHAANAATSSCKPWVIAASIVIVVLVVGAVAVAIVVTNNNNSSDSSDVTECVGFTCSPSSFSGTSCVPSSSVCNGIWDCYYGEDEVGCSVSVPCDGYTCPSGYSSTTNCIFSTWVCDGITDCINGEDEEGCNGTASICNGLHTCPLGTIFNTGMCIDQSQVCDGHNDCIGGSDEQNCQTPGCPPYSILCNGNCVANYYVCDGHQHCPNGEDEQGCSTVCTTNQFYCPGGSSWFAYGYCIPFYLQCDGTEDCSGGHDEENCSGNACSSNQFTCVSGGVYGNCIPSTWQCDQIIDCVGATDEVNCNVTCSAHEFRCDNGSSSGVCIPAYSRCNGVPDCYDGADEENCDNVTCSSSQFNCVNGGSYGYCIPSYWECDNIIDCVGATDEINCNITCPSYQYKCVHGSAHGVCVSSHWRCDGVQQCYNGTDELNCDKIYVCEGSQTEIFKTDVCDGKENCPGGEDEDRCLIAPNGGDVFVYSVATASYYNFCGLADGWSTSKSDAACQALGYSSSASTTEEISSNLGIVCSGDFNITALVQRNATNCTDNKVVRINCTETAACGVITKTHKIVGGEDADIEDHPWQISLQQGSGTLWSPFCGGTIVGARWIVTAAHCVDSISEAMYECHRVVAGITSTAETISSANVYTINKIVHHPLYNTATIANDIAVIKVNEAFAFSQKIQPACLPPSGRLFPDDADAIATGWGATSEGGSVTNVLQAVTVPLITAETCRTSFSGFNHFILDGMICAGLEEGGKDACQGDSGGPLVVSDDSRSFLVGATSWGFGCARPNKPGVYADVSYFADWIEREMEKTPS